MLSLENHGSDRMSNLHVINQKHIKVQQEKYSINKGYTSKDCKGWKQSRISGGDLKPLKLKTIGQNFLSNILSTDFFSNWGFCLDQMQHGGHTLILAASVSYCQCRHSSNIQKGEGNKNIRRQKRRRKSCLNFNKDVTSTFFSALFLQGEEEGAELISLPMVGGFRSQMVFQVLSNPKHSMIL